MLYLATSNTQCPTTITHHVLPQNTVNTEVPWTRFSRGWLVPGAACQSRELCCVVDPDGGTKERDRGRRIRCTCGYVGKCIGLPSTADKSPRMVPVAGAPPGSWGHRQYGLFNGLQSFMHPRIRVALLGALLRAVYGREHSLHLVAVLAHPAKQSVYIVGFIADQRVRPVKAACLWKAESYCIQAKPP